MKSSTSSEMMSNQQDTVNISTSIGTYILKKLFENAIKKKFNRSVDIQVASLAVRHDEGKKVRASISLTATMTEAELNALLAQSIIGG